MRTKRFTRTVVATALAAGVLVTGATTASALGLGGLLGDGSGLLGQDRAGGPPVGVDSLMDDGLPISDLGVAEGMVPTALPGSTTKPLAGPVVPPDAVDIIEVKRTVQTFRQSGLLVGSSEKSITQIGDLAGGF